MKKLLLTLTLGLATTAFADLGDKPPADHPPRSDSFWTHASETADGDITEDRHYNAQGVATAVSYSAIGRPFTDEEIVELLHRNGVEDFKTPPYHWTFIADWITEPPDYHNIHRFYVCQPNTVCIASSEGIEALENIPNERP